jgi:excisionase family DNA binding protein
MRRQQHYIEDEVLDLQEAAELLKMKPNTVKYYARSQQIPGERIGKKWRFSKNELLERVRK